MISIQNYPKAYALSLLLYLYQHSTVFKIPKKRTVAEVLDTTGTDYDLERHKVNGDKVRKDLEKGTKINYVES